MWKQIKTEAGLYLMFTLSHFQDYLHLVKDIFQISKEKLEIKKRDLLF